MKNICKERREGVRLSFAAEKKRARALIPGTQLALYVMVGGGLIGRFYAEQPEYAYRDTRAGRAPFKTKEVEAMRGALLGLADVCGMDGRDMPRMADFHAAGVF